MAVATVRKLVPVSRADRYAIFNSKGEELGKVECFMVDPDNGRVAYVIISLGKIIGDKWFAIPFQMLSRSGRNDRFILDVPLDILQKAPGLDKNKLPEEVDLSWLKDVYQYYGGKPYWEGREIWMPVVGIPEPMVLLASKNTNMKVRNQQNEDVGTIEDFIIDLHSGCVAFAVVVSGRIAGIGGKAIAVPLSAFTVDMEKRMVYLNLDRKTLDSAPEVKRDEWRSKVSYTWLSSIYGYYKSTPYWIDSRIWQRRGTMARADIGQAIPAEPLLHQSSGIIGNVVKDRYGERIGKLEELMLDFATGCVACAVLSFTDAMGVGDKLFPVPLEVLTIYPKENTVHTTINKQMLDGAPSFDRNMWPTALDRAWLTDIYTHYGFTPYWKEEREEVFYKK